MKSNHAKILSFLFGIMGLFSLVQCAPQEPPVPPKTPAQLLVGQWQSTCIQTRSHGIAESTQLEVRGEETTMATRVSRESDCSITDIEVTRTFMTDVKEPAADASPLSELEATPLKTTIEPVTELGASLMRIVKWCGKKDWQVGLKITLEGDLQRDEKECLQNLNLPNHFVVKKENTLYFSKSQTDVSAKGLDEVFFYRRIK